MGAILYESGGWNDYIAGRYGERIDVTTLSTSGSSGTSGNSGSSGTVGYNSYSPRIDSRLKPKPLTEKEFMRKYTDKLTWKQRVKSFFKTEI